MKKISVLMIQIIIMTSGAGTFVTAQADSPSINLEFARFVEFNELIWAKEYCARVLNNDRIRKRDEMDPDAINNWHMPRFTANQYGWRLPTLDEMMRLDDNSDRWREVTATSDKPLTESFSFTTTQCDTPQGSSYGNSSRTGTTHPQYDFGPNTISPLSGFMAIDRHGNCVCVTQYAIRDVDPAIDYADHLHNTGPNGEKKGAILVTHDPDGNLRITRKNVGAVCVREVLTP